MLAFLVPAFAVCLQYLKYLYRLGNNLGTNAVTRQDCKLYTHSRT